MDGSRFCDDLSPSTLAALREHMFGIAEDHFLQTAPNSADSDEKPPLPLLFPSQQLEATLSRLHVEDRASIEGAIQRGSSWNTFLVASSSLAAGLDLLHEDGVVRFDHVLSPATCDALIQAINHSLSAVLLDLAIPNSSLLCNENFGNVYARLHRYDMYLPLTGVHQSALSEIMQGVVGEFFRTLFLGDDSSLLHEYSSLISDPGAERQPIHPDNTFQPIAPFYSAFVALQDVDDSMGPTLFLPGTHTQDAHQLFNAPASQDEFLSRCEYRSSLLGKGDIQIFDSRLLHCGLANLTSRRVLVYFTLKNPFSQDDSAGPGSLMKGLENICPFRL